MRHAIVPLLALVLAALIAAPAGAEPMAGSGPAVGTVAENLNLRSGPSLGSPVLLVMPAGARIYRLPGGEANGFAPILYEETEDQGIEGWASSQYLVFADTPIRTVTVDLNLRSGPGLGYPVLVVMAAGSTVATGDGAVDDFIPVSSDGVSGWAAVAFLV